MRKLLFILLLFPSVLFGQVYYVSSAGTDAAGEDGSLDEPWATLSYACSRVATGLIDVVTDISDFNRCNVAVGVNIQGVGNPTITVGYVAVGTTDGYLYLNSPVGNAVDGNQSISYLTLNGNNTVATRGVAVNFRSNVKFHHCTVEDFLWVGVRFYGTGSGWNVTPSNTLPTGNEVYSCVFDNNCQRGGSDAGGIRSDGQSGMLIHHNSFTQNSRALGLNGNIFTGYQNYGLKVYNNTFTKPDNNYTTSLPASTTWNFFMEFHYSHGGVEIYNNEFIGMASVDFSGTVAGTYGYGGKIYGNTFRTASGGHAPYNPHNEPFITLESFSVVEDVEIYKNKFSWGRIAINIGNITTSADNISIHTNIIENTGNSTNGNDDAIKIHSDWADVTPIPMSDISIYNNVITAGKVTDSGIATHVLGTITNFNIRNNIIYGTFGRPVKFTTPSSATINTLNINNNIYFGNTTTSVSYSGSIAYNDLDDTGNLTSDPVFLTAADYRLQPTSPAIGTGYYVALSTDYLGNTWNNPPSRGAYEFNVIEPPVIEDYPNGLLKIGNRFIILNNRLLKIN